MRVKSVTYKGKADVFNMTVDDTHDFVIQGGVISHNCDTLRYFCMMNPVPPLDTKTGNVIISDPLNQFSKPKSRQQQLFIR